MATSEVSTPPAPVAPDFVSAAFFGVFSALSFAGSTWWANLVVWLGAIAWIVQRRTAEPPAPLPDGSVPAGHKLVPIMHLNDLERAVVALQSAEKEKQAALQAANEAAQKDKAAALEQAAKRAAEMAEAAVKAGFAVDLAVHAVMVLRSRVNNDDDEDNNDDSC